MAMKHTLVCRDDRIDVLGIFRLPWRQDGCFGHFLDAVTIGWMIWAFFDCRDDRMDGYPFCQRDRGHRINHWRKNDTQAQWACWFHISTDTIAFLSNTTNFTLIFLWGVVYTIFCQSFQ